MHSQVICMHLSIESGPSASCDPWLDVSRSDLVRWLRGDFGWFTGESTSGVHIAVFRHDRQLQFELDNADVGKCH